MKVAITFAALLLASTAPAIAQTANSGSNSNSASGSQSGAASNQTQGQTANNAGIGTSSSASDSHSTSGAVSGSESNGNMQGQGQTSTNDAHNSQSQGQTASVTTGQNASNMQGVSVSNTFNSTQLKRTYVSTNTAVPLAASSSFSSDYCGGTVSGGASVAPIGVSIGASAPKFDDSCKYLRVAEKSGMMAANWHNMGQDEMAYKMEELGTWATCMAGPRAKPSENATMQACIALGLMGHDVGAGGAPITTQPPAYVAPSPAVTPMETQKPNVTPAPANGQEYYPAKTPRGATEPLAVPGSYDNPVPNTASN